MKAIAQEVQQSIVQAIADDMTYCDTARQFGVSLRTIGRYTRGYQRRKNEPVMYDLTGLQLEVIELVAHGLSNIEIAERLCIHIHTVRNQVHLALNKLHLNYRSQLVVFAHQKRLVDLDEVILPGSEHEQQ